MFIARKLGYARVRIRLEDREKTWPLTGSKDEDLTHFQHELPGHRYCFLELGVSRSIPEESLSAVPRATHEATFKILSDLLAEGRAKAILAWKRQRQLPVRFDARLTSSPPGEPVMPASIPVSVYRA